MAPYRHNGHRPEPGAAFIALMSCLALGFIAIIAGALAGDSEPKTQLGTKQTELTAPTTTEPPTTTEKLNTTTTEATATTKAPTTTTAPPSTEPPAPKETPSQKNARQNAENYLESQAFSRSGLVDQLTFEGFTPEQADYGVSTTGL